MGVSLVAMVHGSRDSNITAVNDTVSDNEGSVSLLNGVVFDEPVSDNTMQ